VQELLEVVPQLIPVRFKGSITELLAWWRAA